MSLVSARRKIMKPSNILCGALLSVIGVAIGANLPRAADAPTGNKGLATGKTTSVDLGREFPGMEGRQLRLRVLTIEPGGYIGLHSHRSVPLSDIFCKGPIRPFAMMAARRHSSLATLMRSPVQLSTGIAMMAKIRSS